MDLPTQTIHPNKTANHESFLFTYGTQISTLAIKKTPVLRPANKTVRIQFTNAQHYFYIFMETFFIKLFQLLILFFIFLFRNICTSPIFLFFFFSLFFFFLLLFITCKTTPTSVIPTHFTGTWSVFQFTILLHVRKVTRKNLADVRGYSE